MFLESTDFSVKSGRARLHGCELYTSITVVIIHCEITKKFCFKFPTSASLLSYCLAGIILCNISDISMWLSPAGLLSPGPASGTVRNHPSPMIMLTAHGPGLTGKTIWFSTVWCSFSNKSVVSVIYRTLARLPCWLWVTFATVNRRHINGGPVDGARRGRVHLLLEAL